MKPTRQLTLAVGVIASAITASSCATSEAKEAKEPNLLYIFPDQYRLHALGIWQNPKYRDILSTIGDPVSTPNIDKLAESGVVFTQACSMYPLSSPHRGMLMSGMYSAYNGLDVNAKVGRTAGLNHEIKCFTNVLKESGYETAYVGKAHWERNEPLFDENDNYMGTTEAPGGHAMNKFDTYVPAGKGRFGNDIWFQQLKGIHFHASSFSNRPDLVGGNRDGEPYYPNEFATTTEANVILKYLDNKDGNFRDESKPFSIIWAINPPHNPYEKVTDCEAESYEQFADLSFDELLLRDNVSYKSEKAKAQLQLTAGVYFALIKSVDREIGRVLDKLEEIGEADNTLIIFTADHGEMLGSQGRMGKTVIYDESYLIPFIIKYPGVMKHRMEDLKLNSIDIMPTVLGLMGLGDNIPESVDGRNYSAGLLNGDYTAVPKPISSYYRVSSDMRGVRTDKYTYMVTEDGDYNLYDLKSDPYQMKSLRLNQIAEADAKLLKDQLAFWLRDSRDSWVESKTNATLVNY